MSSGRVYTISGVVTGVTTAQSLIQIKAGASTMVEILRAWISNTTSETSDTGIAEIHRNSAAATVSSQAALKHHDSDQAAKAVNGTAATGIDATGEGTPGDVLIVEGFNVLAGWTWLPTPEERIWVPPAGFLLLKSDLAISSVTLACGITFREVG